MSGPVVDMTDWRVVKQGRDRHFIGRTVGHPSPHVTPGAYVMTSRIVGAEWPYVVTESGTKYVLAADWGDLQELFDDIIEGRL